MHRAQQAAERLETALTRLQDAVAPLADVRRDARADAEKAEKTALECDKLRARIATLEAEARAMSATTAKVEERLDAAIAEIRSVLTS